MNALRLYWHTDFERHQVSAGHPESVARIQAVKKGLGEEDIWNSGQVVDAPLADLALLTSIHPEAYVERVKKACQSGPGVIDSMDTEVSPGSWDAALRVVGAGCLAVDHILTGKTRTAFIPGRPPGHHARREQAMGFCLFANISLAAVYALDHYDIDRLAIVDWDVHHGNGTQEIFYHNERVLYVSVHEHPLFPGTGRPDETGSGQGLGCTLNFPLKAGCGDDEYAQLIKGPIADRLLEFNPDIILISAGFDAHLADPLGHMRITTDGFRSMTESVTHLASTTSQGRIISFLEGGYNLEALSDSIAAHVNVFKESTL